MATISMSWTISGADQTRVVAAYQVAANADLNGSATPTQVLNFIQKGVKQQIIDTTKAFEKAAAEATADAGITTVTLT